MSNKVVVILKSGVTVWIENAEIEEDGFVGTTSVIRNSGGIKTTVGKFKKEEIAGWYYEQEDSNGVH